MTLHDPSSRGCRWWRATTLLFAAVSVVVVGCTTLNSRNAGSVNSARATAAAAVGGLEGGGTTSTNNNGVAASSGVPAASSSLAAGGNTSGKTSGGTPDWVLHFPTDPAYFIGIGGASDTGNPASDVEKARKTARNALASEIETTIHSSTNLTTKDNSKGDSENSLTVLIDEQVNLRLEGIQLVDSYHSKKLGYWFYYRLPRTALDARPTISKGVADLMGQLDGPAKLSLGPITYSNTGLSSAFSLYLEDQILLALHDDKRITVSATKLRSMGAKSAAGGAPAAPSTGGEGVVLTGTFFGGSAGKISIFLRLTDSSKNTVVAESSFKLNQTAVPSSVSLVPANYSVAIAMKKRITIAPVSQPAAPITANGGFQVHLWTNRGQDPTYLDGEDLVVNFSTTRDCYVKMYHIDVNGHASLILPNRFSQENFFRAGKTYQIPSSGAPYRFLLGAPYGTEFITVIASTRRFGGTEKAFADLGPATRSLLTRGLTVEGTPGTSQGASGGQPGEPAQTAQAIVSYTILPRGEG